MNRANIIRHAKASIDKGSKSFALASRIFDRKTRERTWLLYAWCRECDDLVDGQDHGAAMSPVCNTEKIIAAVRMLTTRALGGELTGKPAFDAIGLIAKECSIPVALTNDVIAGFALDAEGWRPQTENDLYQYCYHVAGAVGCMMGAVMGISSGDTETLDRACDLGIAFQLANISRDVAEDAATGRCYLPREWLMEKSIDQDDLMASKNRDGLVELIARLCDLAEEYEKSARAGVSRLPFRSRWAVLAAAGIYGDIARAVKRSEGASLEQRIIIGRIAKINWVIRAFVQAMLKSKVTRRGGLWTSQKKDVRHPELDSGSRVSER